ncbi:MAG: tetratricopeptide repeat protein [Bacteroidia bacterium]
MKRSKDISANTFSALSMILLFAGSLIPFLSQAQKEKQFIYKGNNAYNGKNYKEAESQYKTGVAKNKDSYKAAFNLGDTYYKQGRYEEAAQQFQDLTHKATSKDTLAKTYHNLGNSLLKSKKYSESIDAYKNALKNNPDDKDTRYNLCYAQQMLKQQQQQQQKNKDKNDKNKDKNKDKDKDKDKKDKDKKDQQDKDKQDKDKQEKDKQEQQNQISKEDAKRILDALQNDEKNLQDKVKKGKVQGRKITIEKDW